MRSPGNRPGLGIHAKSTAAGGRVADLAAAEMWADQREAGAILNDRKAVRVGDDLVAGYVYRVAMCQRGIHGIEPGIRRSPDGSKAEFIDVMTCGSVWHCPICSKKVTTGRREELNAALVAWKGRGGVVYLLTLTGSHGKADALEATKGAMRKALSKVKGSRAWRELMARAGHVGSIRALEVTHGEINGWHPHTHELVFARPDMDRTLRKLRRVWVRALIKAGLAGIAPGMDRAEVFGQLRSLLRHGLTVQDGTYAADYVAKFGMEAQTDNGGRWGMASELTKAHAKIGNRLTGRTPFTLLRRARQGDERARRLFREYAESFHGERQLYWSSSLRASLIEHCETMYAECYLHIGAAEAMEWKRRAGVLRGEVDDAALAARADERCTEFVSRIDPKDWRNVIATNTRYHLLSVAASQGARGVELFLSRLAYERHTHSGEFFDDRAYVIALERAA